MKAVLVRSYGQSVLYLTAVAMAVALLAVACDAREDPFLAGDRATPTADASGGVQVGAAAPDSTKTAEELMAASEAAEAAYLEGQYVPIKGVIRLGNSKDSKSVQLENAIAGYIIVYGYEYKAELLEMSAEDQQAALPAGDLDILLEVSRTESADWYKRNTESGAMIDVGSLFETKPDLRIGIHPDLDARAPEVTAFLEKMTPGDERISNLASLISEGRAGVNPVAAALSFLKNHEETWTQWVPSEVADRVRAAIKAGKTSLANRKCYNTGGYGTGLMCN